MRYNFSCLIFESQLFDVDLYFKFNITNQKLLYQSQHQQQNSNNTLTNPYSFGSVGISLTGNHNNNGQSGNLNQFSNGQSSSNNGGNSAYNTNLNSIDVFSSCFTSAGSASGSASKESINLFPQSVGLLEVLPLNYKNFSCSNGTQMEKTSQKQDTNLYVLPDFFSFFDKQQSDVS